MTEVALPPQEWLVAATEREPKGLLGLIGTRDHKQIGLMVLGTALLLLFLEGALALVMRAQLARPDQMLVSQKVYDELFSAHGSGMIYLVITPIALGLGIYLVPLQVGAPFIAAPRLALFGFWMYIISAVTIYSGYLTGNGGDSVGWYAFEPLANSTYTPGKGMDLWVAGVFFSAVAMLCLSVCVLWTALRMRAPGMTLLRIPLFTWSMIVTCFMSVVAFPALMAAMAIQAIGRVDPSFVSGNAWTIGYQNIFWFYGHPVVYIMFFPFVGCVTEVLACFAGRRYHGYKPTVIALLVFSTLSMTVWAHHMFTTFEVSNDYYSFTSISLSIPAGAEYFGFLSTLLTGRLRFSAAMHFAIAFIPQFLIGGLTGVMLGTPTNDYMFHGTYFVVGHFHYTLFAGSVFGLFAGIFFWWPKATGWRLGERLGKLQFWVMVLGTNLTFMPMLAMAFFGMSRRQLTYPSSGPLDLLNALSSAGAALIAAAMTIFAFNVVLSYRKRAPVPDDPWGGHSLEWATSCPPPRYNFVTLPPVRSYAPLQDLREEAAERLAQEHKAASDDLPEGVGAQPGEGP